MPDTDLSYFLFELFFLIWIPLVSLLFLPTDQESSQTLYHLAIPLWMLQDFLSLVREKKFFCANVRETSYRYSSISKRKRADSPNVIERLRFQVRQIQILGIYIICKNQTAITFYRFFYQNFLMPCLIKKKAKLFIKNILCVFFVMRSRQQRERRKMKLGKETGPGSTSVELFEAPED